MATRPKPKPVNYELIPRKFSPEPYELLDEALEFHEELGNAKIALAWHKALKPDADGHLVLGKCVRISAVYRELQDYDFVIVLNREVWNDPAFTREKKLALIDHELCHAMPVVDDQGEQREDEKGRLVWRSRKHDIEEFQDIVRRHGCYKRDLESFAENLLKNRKTPLFETANAK